MGLEKVDSSVFEITPFLGLGRIAPFQLERNVHSTRIRLFWHRIAVWSLLLGLIAWVSLSSAAFYYVKYTRGFTTVRYNHLLFFPWQKEDYRKTKCAFLIAKGKRQFAEKQYLESFYNMRLGLLEVPEDVVARQNLARLYHSVKRYDLAELMLLEGVSYNIENFDYVVSVFQYMFSLQRDDAAIEQARTFLKIKDLTPEVHNMLVLAEASAHFFRGRNEAAERILRDQKLTIDRIGGLLRAQITWELGHKEDALRLLALHAQRYPAAKEIYRQQVAYLIDTERFADLRSVCVLRQIEHPDEPRPFVDELHSLSPETDWDRWSRAVDAIFSRFPANAEVMDALAELAVSMGRPELAERVYDQCRSDNLPWIKAAMAMVEANLVVKRYNAALRAASNVLDTNKDWASAHGAELNALRAVANYALGDTSLADLQLQSYLESVPPENHNLVAVAERFVAIGAPDQARTVLKRALSISEFNQPALTRLTELEEDVTEASLVRAERLLTMRMPSAQALRVLAERLQSDRYVLQPGRVAVLSKIAARTSS